MYPFESLALAWFGGLFVAAPFAGADRRRRLAVLASCLALALFIGLVAVRLNTGVRAWLPHGYLVLGYWLPGILAPSVSHPTAFETWLVRSDAALRPRLPAVPPVLTPLVELAYLVCYPLVPVAFAIVWARGEDDDVARFWVAVLLAGYACYGSLPWLVSRPPRIVEGAMPIPGHRVAAANAFVLGRVSHQLTTFPSGHVAVSSAAAGALMAVSAPGGLIVGAVAAAIAIGAVAGRYHYVIDVVLGLFVAAVAVGAALMS